MSFDAHYSLNWSTVVQARPYGAFFSHPKAMSSQLALDDPLVFISYAKEDRAKASKLCGQLRDLNLKPWLDQHHLAPGQHWELSIRRAITRCRIFLLLLSCHSVNKRGYVQSEIRQALKVAEEQPPGKTYIVPIRLEECEVPDALRHLQWVDVFRPGGKQKLFDSLIRNLGIDGVPLKCAAARHSPPPAGLPPLDQLVSDLIIYGETLWFGTVGKGRYAVSDSRFLVLYKSEPTFVKQLQMLVPKQRQVTAATLRRIIPPRNEYCRDDFRVRSIVFGRRHNRPTVELHTANAKRTAVVDIRFWSLTAVICADPAIFLASDDSPVIVDDGKSPRMVIMPLRRF